MESQIRILGPARRMFAREFKLQILKENRENGVPISVLARKHGIHPITIYQWRRNQMSQDDSKKDLMSSNKLRELLLENERLKNENKTLKSKVGDLFLDKEILEAALAVVKKKSLLRQAGLEGKSKKKKDSR